MSDSEVVKIQSELLHLFITIILLPLLASAQIKQSFVEKLVQQKSGWIVDCEVKTVLGAESKLSHYRFRENSHFQYIEAYYSDKECREISYQISYEGSMDGGVGKGSAETFTFQLDYVSVTLFSIEVETTFNKDKICGLSDWEVGSSKLIEKSCGNVISIQKTKQLIGQLGAGSVQFKNAEKASIMPTSAETYKKAPESCGF